MTSTPPPATPPSDPGAAPVSPPQADRPAHSSRSPAAPQPGPSLSWASAGAYAKHFLWQLATKVILGAIYVGVISEGLRHLVPALAQKVYSLAGLSFLRDYEATYRLDLALFLSVFMLIAVWWLWEKILQLWLQAEDDFDDHGWNSDAHRRLIVTLGVVILGADACLFYVAVSQAGWSGTRFSVSALLATAAYLAILLFVSFVSIHLRRAISACQTKE